MNSRFSQPLKRSNGSNSSNISMTKSGSSSKFTPLIPTTVKTSASQVSSKIKSATSESLNQNIQRDNHLRCRYCARTFNSDRLPSHENICRNHLKSKRTVFDSKKFRLQGTEMEQFQFMKGSVKNKKNFETKPKQSNWRQQHEEFINSIRAAKEVSRHLANGGKLSDLPPPSLSSNPDYIQCPYCNRRFNESAANRHIPKCETMVHNKPKPFQSGASSLSRPTASSSNYLKRKF